MRIIGGTYRGRIISRVDNKSTRETADMVRQAVFNMLGGTMFGSVLDLFAGSGAYGLEAISRGAKRAIFVDKEKAAIKTIEKNAELLKCQSVVTIYQMDYQTYLKSLTSDAMFDVIFLDPPYQMDIYVDVITHLRSHLHPEGMILCESAKTLVLPDEILDLKKIKDKTYGIKRVSIYQ
ncbi:MAG: 16S rRNA (guanine(966)-N(2))-methyltransferase RsmD [Acholeplasma sp.]|jgi:16S rRNA (guanine(966)-N(2))-methyltransferase RsmD|nr:MAG: 16S rRNA (guanine(966)-N(2))-methyltransferase RsmD [Acholeplasma sp.]